MALGGALTSGARLVLAPFRIHGTDLPPNILLIVKLIVLGLVCKGYHRLFPDVFAPLLPIFEWIPAPYWRHTLRIAFVFAAAALLFNQAVRTSCLVLGVVFIAATLSSRVYYRNANVFVGLVFLMSGLQNRKSPPTLLAWQLGLMYLAAGFNKFLDPDWRSGQYFAHFFSVIYRSDFYAKASVYFPPGWLASYLCWHVIAAEVTAGTTFFFARFRRVAVWLAAGVHAGAAMMTGTDYGIYMAAVLTSYLIVLSWPTDLRVQWRRSGVSAALVAVHRLSHGSDPAVRYEPAPDTALRIELDGRRYKGIAAFWRMALVTPTLYVLAMVVLTGISGPWNVRVTRVGGGAIAILLAVAAVAWLWRRWRSEPVQSLES